MSNCGCNQPCNCNHGAGVVPGPCVKLKCPKEVCNVRFKTEVLPASVGTDAEGQPYAPKLGAYTNTVLTYQANGALYFYDSRGIYTKVEDAQLKAELEAEVARATQAEAMLQENINAEVNARESDRDNLQTNINAEVNAREAADATLKQDIETAENNLQSQIDTIVDSTDVKDVVGTYAELEAYDKSTLGDNDIIKVLADETHEGATTYYRYNKTDNDFTFIGSVGPYYTKAEADELLQEKQDTLVSGTNIKTVNGESLLGEGDIEISGGGSEAQLYTTSEFSRVDSAPTGVNISSQKLSVLEFGNSALLSFNMTAFGDSNALVTGSFSAHFFAPGLAAILDKYQPVYLPLASIVMTVPVGGGTVEAGHAISTAALNVTSSSISLTGKLQVEEANLKLSSMQASASILLIPKIPSVG